MKKKEQEKKYYTFMVGEKERTGSNGTIPARVCIRAFIANVRDIKTGDKSFRQISFVLQNRAKQLEYLLDAEENSLSVDDRDNIFVNAVVSQKASDYVTNAFNKLEKKGEAIFYGYLGAKEYNGKDTIQMYVKEISVIRWGEKGENNNPNNSEDDYYENMANGADGMGDMTPVDDGDMPF